MKKFTLFLSALLFSMMSFGAPLGEGYSKVTDITTLSAGDKVVLYCDDAELGVTGWNGNKDANVAATGWVEYVVEAVEGGVYLKDGDQYITGAESANHFKYGEKAVCGVSASGVLACGSKFLYENDAQYYRMYTDKSSDSKYKPFYVYQVTGEGGGTTPDDGGETPEVTADTITCAEAATIAAAANYVGTDTVTVVGYVTELGNAKEDGSKQCFYMADTKDGGKVFMAYWAFVSKLYVVGDKVAVTGILKNYNGTIEIVDGQSALLEAAAGETPDDGGETPDDGGETPEDGKVTFAAASDKGNSTSDSNNAAEYTITKNGVTMVVSQGVVTDHYRIYKNQTLTISAAGKTITSIEITCIAAGEEKYGPGCFVTETPTYTYSEKIGTWTGEATEVTFTASLNQVRATQIVVTVAETSEDFVATPVISGEADFLENTTVTITAEEGLEVYYTLDGTDPTKASTKYTAPFELTATTIVKAIAYNGDKASAVVEKKFTKMTILTCAEAVALCTNPATPGQHIIRGYVTEMIEAYNDQYKNITFWMADTPDGGQVLQAFRVKPVSDVEQALKVGDFVEVIGSLILYTKDGVSIPEVNAGGSVKLITAGSTAVDNVTVNQQATKFIENGQLFIVKNGVRYNALGQVTK